MTPDQQYSVQMFKACRCLSNTNPINITSSIAITITCTITITCRGARSLQMSSAAGNVSSWTQEVLKKEKVNSLPSLLFPVYPQFPAFSSQLSALSSLLSLVIFLLLLLSVVLPLLCPWVKDSRTRDVLEQEKVRACPFRFPLFFLCPLLSAFFYLRSAFCRRLTVENKHFLQTLIPRTLEEKT
jgi:hypothetical protein